jgi:SOS-response transcriptional repressor LexA
MTEKQASIYRFIDEWWKEWGYAPSVSDIMRGTNDKSRSSVQHVLTRLCEMGLCKKIPRKKSIRPSNLRIRSVL